MVLSCLPGHWPTYSARSAPRTAPTLHVSRPKAGGERIAQRLLANGKSTLYYLHGDHLGSTSATTCGTGCGTAGALIARQLYYPFGNQQPAGTWEL